MLMISYHVLKKKYKTQIYAFLELLRKMSSFYNNNFETELQSKRIICFKQLRCIILTLLKFLNF